MQVIFIRGIPGSGKSSLATLFRALGYKHFEADQYFIEPDGSYVFKKDDLQAAHNFCKTNFSDALKAGEKVVVSNTFTREWEIVPYIKICEEAGIIPFILTCENYFGNIHNIPEETIDKMYERFERL